MRSEDIFAGAPGGGWRNIRLDIQRRRVTLPAGTKLDFGGIAKGMAVDAALAELRLDGISTAIVNAGGDLAVSGLPPFAESWPIAVPGRDRSWTLPLRSGAIATSGIAYRQWQQGQTLRHHLLDPHTGLPVQGDLWSVTVVADRCEQAEVAAKTAFILGAREGTEFLHTHQLAGLIIHKDGTWQAVEPWPLHMMEE
jgi:thiamine biosynthesis lipoprotein